MASITAIASIRKIQGRTHIGESRYSVTYLRFSLKRHTYSTIMYLKMTGKGDMISKYMNRWPSGTKITSKHRNRAIKQVIIRSITTL